MTRAYFLGAGLHTCLGAGLSANIDALFKKPPLPDEIIFHLREDSVHAPILSFANEPLDLFGSRTDIEERFWRCLFGVVDEALRAADLGAADLAETALLIGTSSFDIVISEADYREALTHNPNIEPLKGNTGMGAVGAALRKRFGIGGPDMAFNTACTASANALLYGDAMVRAGLTRHAIIVGVEACNLITALGFGSLGLLARDGMRPFDANRRGLIIGEACAALVIGPKRRHEHAFHLSGGANICDTHGISTANPDGESVADVMIQALKKANIETSAIRSVKTHGTATLMNDEAEASGLKRVFNTLPALCALKPFIGHSFGACGLSELLLHCGMVERGYIPATPGICAEESDLGVRLAQTPSPTEPGAHLLNYFGFGGNSTCLVVSNADA